MVPVPVLGSAQRYIGRLWPVYVDMQTEHGCDLTCVEVSSRVLSR